MKNTINKIKNKFRKKKENKPEINQGNAQRNPQENAQRNPQENAQRNEQVGLTDDFTEVVSSYRYNKGKASAEKLAEFAKFKNKQAFQEMSKSCENDSERIGIYASAMQICAENNDKDALRLVANYCKPRLKPKALSRAIVSSAKLGNEKAAIAIAKVVKEKEKEKVFSQAMNYCFKNDDKKAFEIVIKGFPRKISEEILLNNIVILAKKPDIEAFRKLANICPSGKVKDDIFSKAISRCEDSMPKEVIKSLNSILRYQNKSEQLNENDNNAGNDVAINNEDAGNDVTVNNEDAGNDVALNNDDTGIDVSKVAQKDYTKTLMILAKKNEIEKIDELVHRCPDKNFKSKIFLNAIMKLAELDEKEALTIVKDKCPEGLKGRVLLYAIIRLAESGKKEAINGVIDMCRPHVTEEMLSRALMNFAKKGDSVAFNLVKDAFPTVLKEEMLSNAIATFAKEENKEALQIVGHACPDNLNVDKFTEVMVTFMKENHKKGLKIVNEVFPNDLRAKALGNAIMNFAKEENKESFYMVHDFCEPTLRAKMFANAIVACLKNGDSYSEALNTVKRKCQNISKIDLFSNIIVICAKEENTDLLKKVYRDMPSYVNKEDMLSEAIVACAKEQKDVALNLINDVLPQYILLRAFGKAMAKTANEGDKETFDILIDACEGIEQFALGIALKHSVLSKDSDEVSLGIPINQCKLRDNEKTIDMVLNACRQEDKIFLFATALVESALENNRFKLAKVVELFTNANKQDEGKNIAIFAMASAICSIESKSKKPYNLVVDQCPAEILDSVLSESQKLLEKDGFNYEKIEAEKNAKSYAEELVASANNNEEFNNFIEVSR